MQQVGACEPMAASEWNKKRQLSLFVIDVVLSRAARLCKIDNPAHTHTHTLCAELSVYESRKNDNRPIVSLALSPFFASLLLAPLKLPLT